MLEIAVCDDNKKELDEAAGMLRDICSQLKRECHISLYQSPADLLTGQQKVDIVILDIVMPECNGIDLGRKLKKKYPEVELIYATSYEDYYKQAINQVHAFSFLAKPLDRAELRDQIFECIEKKAKNHPGKTLVFENVRDSGGNEFASVRIRTEDILYCEYMKSKREVAMVLEKETYFYKVVFEKLSRLLQGYGFAVNCRGSVVNIRHIKRLKGYTIYLDNGMELPLAQKRVTDFKERMNAYIHKA